MDGLCKKQCSIQENRNYTLLDSPGCRNWKISESEDRKQQTA